MPKTKYSKCLECHIKVANYLIHLVRQVKLKQDIPNGPPYLKAKQACCV